MHTEDLRLDTRVDIAKFRAPGTCGEFVQGHIRGQDFLVNCPIDLYAYAEVSMTDGNGLAIEQESEYHKIRDTLTLAAYELFLPLRHAVKVSSHIPRGKGMASSSADIGAALSAFLHASGHQVSPLIFARLLTEVEPSDCVHFSGIAHLNHLTGDLLESLPAPSGMRALIVDCGGEIDTLSFDRQRARAVYRTHEDSIVEALETLKLGLRNNDLHGIAQAATMSATLSQLIHRKPQFEDLLACTTDKGALGVNCAHSGSVLGILYRENSRLQRELRETVLREFGNSLTIVGDHKIIAGGCDVL
jgi:L-threonine kinase